MAEGSKHPSSVYTVLALIAFVALASAVGYVGWKNTVVTGQQNPFFIMQPGE